LLELLTSALYSTQRIYQKNNRDLLISLAFIALFILATIIIITGFLIRAFLRKPLNSLNEIVASYATGMYDSAVVQLPYLEFRPFGHILAQMGEKIEEQIRELQGAEEKYRSIYEHAIEGIFQSTTEGSYIRVNPSMARILGYDSPDDLITSTTDVRRQQYVVPGRHDELFRRFDNMDTISDFEVQLYRKDKKTIWASINARAVRDEDGRLVYLEGFLTDVTERKSADDALKASEKRLKKSEHRFRDLFASISDVIFTHDLDGRFLSMNPATCRLFGYNENELIGRLISDFMEPEFVDGFESEYLDTVKKDGYHEGTIIFFTRDGVKVYIEYRGSIVTPRDGEPFISGIGRDVTVKILSEREVKALQDQLIQSQKIEAIGTLAGGIAHNFNNILMGIQGSASLMMVDKDPSHPEMKYLKGIEEYVRNATELTKDLLGFARGGKYEAKPMDLNALIMHENRMFGRTKKENQVHGEYENDLWTAEVDRGQLKQVLLNLYVNAWQAMPGGGDLYIQTENVTLDEAFIRPFLVTPGKYVKVSVTDTGTGMDEETQKRIFDPFFSTKNTRQGSGLGMASVYGIIKNHGGFIDVYSKKGEGTTISIYLPASEKEAELENPQPDQHEFQPGRGTILLVDDEDMIIDVGQQMLERLGYQVLVARGGKMALDIYGKQREEIDLVILDMIMPGMGGGETYERMKEIDDDIRVVLSSGYSINGQAKKILDRGCISFIQKPFTLNELSLKLREALV